jgi:hypothetical protein
MPRRETEQLVAQADAEHGVAAEEIAHDRRLLLERLGSPGPFERTTPSKRASSSAGVVCGHTVTAAPASAEPSHDRALRSVVDDGDVRAAVLAKT